MVNFQDLPSFLEKARAPDFRIRNCAFVQSSDRPQPQSTGGAETCCCMALIGSMFFQDLDNIQKFKDTILKS